MPTVVRPRGNLPPRDLAHGADCSRAQASALEVPRNHDHECAEGVRVTLVEATSDRTVDAGRQVLDRAVPPERDRARPREDLVVVSDEIELESGQLLGEARPILVE